MTYQFDPILGTGRDGDVMPAAVRTALAADAAAGRTALDLGTAATTAATAYATAAQGARADAALPANADAIADVLEAASTGAPADLARIKASVAGADYIATTIGGMTATQSSTAKLPRVSFAKRNQGVAFTVGALSIRLGSSPVSLEYAFDHGGNATQISKLTASASASNYLYNNPYAANTYQLVHPGLNITNAGALQDCIVYDMTAGVVYVCVLIVGAGYANNILRVEVLQ